MAPKRKTSARKAPPAEELALEAKKIEEIPKQEGEDDVEAENEPKAKVAAKKKAPAAKSKGRNTKTKPDPEPIVEDDVEEAVEDAKPVGDEGEPKKKGPGRARRAPVAASKSEAEEASENDDHVEEPKNVGNGKGRPGRPGKKSLVDSKKVEEPAEEVSDYEEPPLPKKAKTDPKKKGGGAAKAKESKTTKSAPASKKGGKKNEPVKIAEVVNEGNEEEEVEETEDVLQEQQKTVIVIEASKECHVFKRSAAKVQEDLEKLLSNVDVVVNPDKPRKGCFEVRDKNGNTYLSLLGMKRPFPQLRDTDLSKIAEEIAEKLK